MGFKLTWQESNLGEDGHRVYRDISPIDPENLPTPIAELPANTTEFEDGDVTDGNTYHYAVSAFLSSGVERVSDSLEVEASEVEVPLDIPGLVHWLSADSLVGLDNEERIPTWEDKSASEADMTQSTTANQPRFMKNADNGQPGVVFTVENRMASPNPTAHEPGGGHATTLYIVMQGSVQTHNSLVYIYRNGRAGMYFRASGDAVGIASGENGANRDPAPITQNDVRAVCVSSEGEDTETNEAWQNGSVWAEASGGNFLTYDAGSEIYIGSTSDSYKGIIYQVLVYNRKITPAERKRLDEWVASKYGVQMGSDY